MSSVDGYEFHYTDVDVKKYDINDIADLIQYGYTKEGSILYVIRNAVDLDICDQITNRFHEIIIKTGSKRGNDGFVKVEQIGSSQFHKNGREYIQSTIDSHSDVYELFSDLDNESIQGIFLDDALEDFYRKNGIIYRASKHLTSAGNFATTRRWLNNGDMSLMPHEDSAQLMFAAEDGFEVHRGQNTIAANVCFCQDEVGSELVVWNLKPSLEFRKELGVEKTGYPYPLNLLKAYKKISVKLNAGDLYFLNASYIHGVESSSENFRISSGRFITKTDQKVVYWT
jgi:hypothetical protein